MEGGKETLYGILGVDKDATEEEIRRAHRKIQAKMQDPTVPPDPRRAVLVSEAFGVLSDPGRRAEYDRQLRSPRAILERERERRPMWLAIGMGTLAAVAAAYFLYHQRPPAPLQKSDQELATTATLAVGRVHGIDLAGQYMPLGLAFTVDAGVMVTVCENLAPNVELVVKFGARMIPGRVMEVNSALGLCKLQVAGAGSWPLPVTAVPQRAGTRIYGADVNGRGEVVLLPATIKAVADAPEGKLIDTTLKLRPDMRGGPMLDADGRAAGIAVKVGEGSRYLSVPVAWLEPKPLPPPPPPPREVETPTAEAAPTPVPGQKGAPMRLNPQTVSPERKEALEKAFKPPPNVPDDL